MPISKLEPTKARRINKSIYGFDIETYDNNKKFLMASIYGDNLRKSFYSKDELISFLKTKRFKNSYICATNLQFDFMGTFYSTSDIMNFDWMWRGSDMIFAKSYIKDRKFIRKFKNNSKPLYFIDTLNYVKMSVDNLGKILNIPKLKESVETIIGQYPKSMTEWETMRIYNMRDAEISQRIIKFFFNSFMNLGATPKMTIASTSMSLFKNKYLNDTYYRHFPDSLLEQFNAYYGGNCHAYCRGMIKDHYYYDFNSLYPSVMMNEYPNPNTKRISHKNSIFYIENFEGISHVDLSCKYMDYPLLPFRTDNKLIFPYGDFTGWYSHLELRKALDLGYIIKKVHKSVYFKDKCSPFEGFIKDLYSLRNQLKKQKDPMELVVKLLMNSLYGKFGQKFTDRDTWIPFNLSKEELDKLEYFERFGNFIRIKRSYTEPPSFCMPIWALYTTSFARLRLHEYILKSNPVYVDTDSIITTKKFHESDRLGELKLEAYIKNGIIVKPKFYSVYGTKSFNKIKGIGVNISKKLFMNFMLNPEITYKKFMKFKESMRRGLIPNEIIDVKKELNLEDDKRIWGKTFMFDDFQISRPVKIIDGMTEIQYEKERLRAEQEYHKQKDKIFERNLELFEENFGDTFDSKGDDISDKEFFENETDFRNI